MTVKQIEHSDRWTTEDRKEINKDKFTLWGYVYDRCYNPNLIDVLNDILKRLEILERASYTTP